MKKYVSAAALRAPLCAALLLCAISNAAFAQTVPSPWTARDIGAPTLAGSATHANGVFTIQGAGADIYGTSDQFHFVYQLISGDVDITARMDDLDGSQDYAKVGVMIRVVADRQQRACVRSCHGRGGCAFPAPDGEQRHDDGRPAVRTWRRRCGCGPSAAARPSPLPRPRTAQPGLRSAPARLSLGTSAYVGIAVNSRTTSARATGVVSNVTVANPVSSSGGGALPTGQQSTDIGAPAVKGSATYSSGAYTVKAGGADIWDTADQFHFVYQPVTGNAEVIARVSSIGNTDDWSKAGVMIREALTAQSKHAMVVTSIAKGYAFQRRPEVGGYSEHTAGGTGTAPGWVRLVRTGDLFEAYRSSTGTTWTKIGSDTIPMTDTVYVGIAATSHDAAQMATDVVDNLKITALGLDEQSSGRLDHRAELRHHGDGADHGDHQRDRERS